MIQTKDDLKYYLKEDAKRYNLSRFNFLYRLMGFETATIWHIQRRFRLFEYAKNNKASLFGKVRYLYCYLRYQRLSIRYGVHLYPNVIAPGLRIAHIGGGYFSKL